MRATGGRNCRILVFSVYVARSHELNTKEEEKANLLHRYASTPKSTLLLTTCLGARRRTASARQKNWSSHAQQAPDKRTGRATRQQAPDKRTRENGKEEAAAGSGAVEEARNERGPCAHKKSPIPAWQESAAAVCSRIIHHQCTEPFKAPCATKSVEVTTHWGRRRE